MNRLNRWARAPMLVGLLALGSCGGGGGGGGDSGGGGVTPPVETPSCTVRVEDFVGVCSGFPNTGNLDWTSGGGGDGGGVGAGASGDGGVGAGGDFGQFRKATIKVIRDDGTVLGEATTDDVKGMVTIRPGKTYAGGLRVELRGGPGAEYFEEGKNAFVPFPADRVIRVWVPRIDKNIGITIFTEAAYQLLTQGSAPESVTTGTPTAAQVRAANQRVTAVLSGQFPGALAVDDITRLPFIKSPSVTQGSFNADKRGIYGVVSGTFSKQAALFNTASATPTLDALDQLAEDLKDGRLDGTNRGVTAGQANRRTYDPNTLTSELTAALSHQAERFGSSAIKATLPPVVNYGGTRYQGYLFDGQINKNRTAISTVAGWLADNSLGLSVGQARPKALPAGQSALTMISNFGHGGAFFKIDSTDTTATPVYRVYALGDNVNGELGTGNRNSTNSALVEVTLPGPLTHAAGGFAHTLLRLADGRVFAMGDNTYGQLGADPGALASTSTPREVVLPAAAGGAVAVAATSVASYALMADGSVYAWGSNGGFGLLGNGSATGLQPNPTKIAALSDVTQISARDNDVVVLKRDQTIWQWGSHPADVNAYTDGDLTSAYRGGTLVPAAVAGLPTVTGGTTPIPVRKIITEQGLFAALLDNGHVYTWGVHFDLSAKAVLRDLTAARVLGLPPVRDLMPGGFVGYGARPFDRLTAMAVDYDSGMWKIRGRVAESFDPANPTVQRRPQTGLARSANCASCHTFLDDTMGTLRARQAAEAPVPASAAVCLPPTSVHVATNGQSLIRAETECIQCHNPARLNPAYAGTLTPAFASSGGWPNCNKPTTLPPRENVAATLITNSCVIPPAHVFTPPGTVCSSCHNSVVARALQDLSPPCAQPGSGELPTLPITAAITGVSNGAGAALADGGYSRDPSVRLSGTLSTALSGAQTLAVLRNGTAVGNAVASGSSWNYTDSGLPSGTTATYTVRVVQGTGFGLTSTGFTVRVDYTPPAAVPTITAVTDDVLGAIADGSFLTDTTPTLTGTLSAAPDAGDVVQVLRNGSVVGSATVSGTGWSYTEPTALPFAVYSYQVRLIDAAGNLGTASGTRGFTLLGGTPTPSITGALDDGGAAIVAGSFTRDATPLLTGTLNAPLLSGQVLRVLRNGGSAGLAAVTGTNWTFTDAAPQGAVSYTARVEAGTVIGSASAALAFSVDNIAPTQTIAVTVIRDDFVGDLAAGATTADQTPTIVGTLSAPLGANEQMRLRRTRSGTGEVVDFVLNPTGTAWLYTEVSLVAAGTYTYSAQVFDAAGNTGSFGATRAVTIDPSAVPLPGAAPTIVAINGIGATSGSVPRSKVTAPVLTGTVARAVATDEVVKIFRVGALAAVGEATLAADRINWSYTSTSLGDGPFAFTAQVQKSADSRVFGQMSATVSGIIDTVAPLQTIGALNLADPSLISVNNNNTGFTTLTLTGNVSALPASDESVQLTRTGPGGPVVIPLVPNASRTFTRSETGLAVGTYTYTVRVVDEAGNLGTASSVNVTVLAPLPAVNTLSVVGSSGGLINSRTHTLSATLSATLPAGHSVSFYRGSISPANRVGSVAVCAPTCSVTASPSVTTDGTFTYIARAESGTAYGSSGSTSITVDTVAPGAPTIRVYVDNKPFQNWPTLPDPTRVEITSGTTTNDVDPAIEITFAALASGERVDITEECVSNCGASPVSNTFTANTLGQMSFSRPYGTGVPLPAFISSLSVSSRTNIGVRITARVVDAAGNVSSTTTFDYLVDYLACSQARAQARSSNTWHNTWPTPSASTCWQAGCHSSVTTAGFVRAPPGGATSQTYVCRKN